MKVVSVNISSQKGTIKKPCPEIRLTGNGIDGDAHAGSGHRQVSLLSIELIREFESRIGRTVKPGEFAENITTSGLDLRQVGLFDRITINDAELEVAQIGKECHGSTCAIFRETGQCIMPSEGVFARVLREGRIEADDKIRYVPYPLRFLVITMSDRASRGELEDRSGPRIRELLEGFLAGRRWHPEIRSQILPDDNRQLDGVLRSACDSGTDVVFITGGTGVGPRDVTPEVVTSIADKIIPGIMEHIRTKFSETNPRAQLSRSVAAVAGSTLLYALPGSRRAVDEYLPELFRTLEHLLVTIHGLDTHG